MSGDVFLPVLRPPDHTTTSEFLNKCRCSQQATDGFLSEDRRLLSHQFKLLLSHFSLCPHSLLMQQWQRSAKATHFCPSILQNGV